MTEPNGAGHTGNGHDPTAAQPPRTGADRLSTTLELWEIAEKLAKLTRTQILIYLDLRCRARDGRGRAFPSLTTIARDTQCARRHAPDAINQLVAVGLIAKEQRRSKTGDFNSTLYTLIEPARGQVTREGSDVQVTRWGPMSHQVVTSHGTKLLKRTRITEQKEEPPVVPHEGDAPAPPPLDGNASKEQADDQPTRRHGRAKCHVDEVERWDHPALCRAYLAQGALDGWLTQGVDHEASARDEFRRFELHHRQAATLSADWHATWCLWLTKIARLARPGGRQRQRGSRIDVGRRAADRGRRGRPLENDLG
jgi:hypothetical protein